MVKVVDHDARRRQIVEVTARLIATEGIASVTTRRIASESGCSLGILSHYFSSKDEIVLGALNWCDQRIGVLLEDLYQTTELSVENFRRIFLYLLPLDEQSDAEWRVRVNLITHSLTHPHLKQARRDSHAYACDIATEFVQKLQQCGEVSTAVSAATVAASAVDMVFGLSVNLLNYPIEERSARVDELLNLLPAVLSAEKMAN